MTSTKTITDADITASIGRRTIRARLQDGTWVMAEITSAFMAPLKATVIRALSEQEAEDAETLLSAVA